MNAFVLLDDTAINPSLYIAKDFREEPISINDIVFYESDECFGKNGLNSVDTSKLRRRFKRKVNIFWWTNRTKKVLMKNKKNEDTRCDF